MKGSKKLTLMRATPPTSSGITLDPPADHIDCDCVIELPYLDAGRRVYVATDEKGWMIASGMAKSKAEEERVLNRLHDARETHQAKPTAALSLVREPRRTAQKPEVEEYRNTVVELPWPDFRGRRVLLAIDGAGRVFDQGTAASESEAQWLTDRMLDGLNTAGPRPTLA